MGLLELQLRITLVLLTYSTVLSIVKGDDIQRYRRAISTVNQLPAADATALLDVHNELRAGVKAEAMWKLDWDSKLADVVQAYVDTCTGTSGQTEGVHNHLGLLASDVIGQNIYYADTGNDTLDVQEVVNGWFGQNTSLQYKQIVWSNSTKLGCAYTECEHLMLASATLLNQTLLICSYLEGAVESGTPFVAAGTDGEVCSQCPNSTTTCDNQCNVVCRDQLCVEETIVTTTQPVPCADWECENGGTKKPVVDGVCNCTCSDYTLWQGDTCDEKTADAKLSVDVNIQNSLAQWEQSWGEMKKAFADVVNQFCRVNIVKCCDATTSITSGSTENATYISDTGFYMATNFPKSVVGTSMTKGRVHALRPKVNELCALVTIADITGSNVSQRKKRQASTTDTVDVTQAVLAEALDTYKTQLTATLSSCCSINLLSITKAPYLPDDDDDDDGKLSKTTLYIVIACCAAPVILIPICLVILCRKMPEPTQPTEEEAAEHRRQWEEYQKRWQEQQQQQQQQQQGGQPAATDNVANGQSANRHHQQSSKDAYDNRAYHNDSNGAYDNRHHQQRHSYNNNVANNKELSNKNAYPLQDMRR